MSAGDVIIRAVQHVHIASEILLDLNERHRPLADPGFVTIVPTGFAGHYGAKVADKLEIGGLLADAVLWVVTSVIVDTLDVSRYIR